MGIFEDLFGGGQQSATSQSSSQYTSNAQNAAASLSRSTPINLNPFTSALYGNVTKTAGLGPQSYNGPLTVNTTPTQDQLMAQITGQVSPGSTTNSWIDSALRGAYMPGGANFNPFVSSMITQAVSPIFQGLQTATGQTLPSQFAASGQQIQGSRLSDTGERPGSTAFTNAEAIASQGAANAAATTAANIENNAYNTGAQTTVAAAQLQPQEIQSSINALQANLLPTLLQEQGISNGLQAFQDNVNALVSFLTSIGGIAGTAIGNLSTAASASEGTSAAQGTSQSTSTATGTTEGGIVPGLTGLFKSK